MGFYGWAVAFQEKNTLEFLEHLHPTSLSRFKKTIPVPEQSMVQTLCYLLECLLTKEDIPADCPKEMYELYFVFAAIWAFGGAMVQDQVRRHAEINTMLKYIATKPDTPVDSEGRRLNIATW